MLSELPRWVLVNCSKIAGWQLLGAPLGQGTPAAFRLYDTEKTTRVLVGWDTPDAPSYRHEALESYQAGRVFDDDLVEQLEVLPEFVAACGFASAKARCSRNWRLYRSIAATDKSARLYRRCATKSPPGS
jgi:hypothetical protein